MNKEKKMINAKTLQKLHYELYNKIKYATKIQLKKKKKTKQNKQELLNK